jgi:hypothetical protein
MDDPDKSLEAAVIALQRLIEDPLSTDGVALQRLLSAAVNAYAARHATGDRMPPFLLSHEPEPPGGSVVTPSVTTPNASDVCVTVSAMLNAVSVEVFELGMWQAWAGAAGS